jgi:perosamine synthetase
LVNYFSHARTAFWYGLHQLPMERGQKILLPEYICEVVLHPLEDLGIEAVYYPVNDSFIPDWQAIEDILNHHNVHAFLLIHYFGQPQNIEKTLEICNKYGLWLIEDNAHGHGGSLDGQPLGSFGDLGFSSPRKQLQCASGGLLYLNGEPVEHLKEELPFFPFSKSKKLIRDMIYPFPRLKVGLRRILIPEPDFSDPTLFPEIRIFYFKADSASTLRILNENWPVHASARREKWCYWSDYADKNGLRPVWSEPHPESCPWVMPVYASSPEDRIKWLRWGWKSGIDLLPWPTLPKSVLKSSSISLARWKHLLCFPLHKEIKL